MSRARTHATADGMIVVCNHIDGWSLRLDEREAVRLACEQFLSEATARLAGDHRLVRRLGDRGGAVRGLRAAPAESEAPRVGVAVIERILGAPDGATIGAVMDPDPPTVTPDTDEEHAAWQAAQDGKPGLAVVDADGRFRGLIAPQQLLTVLAQEHDEDLARLGGFLHSVEAARASSVETVVRRLWHRLPWLLVGLLVGLLGAMLSAGLMAGFEKQLDANLAVAYFVPGIVYLADAVGTQTETLAIRGLSVGIGIRRIVGPEVLTGFWVGTILGVVMAPMVALMTGDWELAAAVAVAVLSASAIATTVAMDAALVAASARQGPGLRLRAAGHRAPGPAVDRDLPRGHHVPDVRAPRRRSASTHGGRIPRPSRPDEMT